MVFRRLTNNEYLTHTVREKALYGKYDANALGFQVVLVPFETELGAFQNSMTLHGNKYLEMKKDNKDVVRDNYFRGFRDHIKADTFHWNNVQADAGERLESLLRKHGWTLYSSTDRIQTAKMIALTDDIDKHHLADVTALGLDEWYSRMKAAQDEFEQIYQQFLTAEAASAKTPAPSSIRPALTKAHTTLRNTLTVLQTINPSDDLKTLISELDELDAQTERSYKASRSSAPIDEGEPKPEGDVNEGII